jgi:ribosomal-protein-alanine N-acetyltransferase
VIPGGQPTLQTERLVLRPFEIADAPTVRGLASAFAIADTTLAIPHPYPDGVAEQWIATHEPGFAAGTLATYAITTRSGGLLVGAIGLVVEPSHSRGELGYWIGVPFWKQGYATEAGRAILTFGFEVMRLHRIQAHYLIRNPASGRVLEKLGMRQEGVHRHAVRKWDRFEDVAQCAILATEWRGRMS